MTERADEADAPLTGVVLAGGHSTRFGPENKALAEFDGRTVLESVVETVAERSDRPPIVAVRSRAQRAELAPALDGHDVRFVRDSPAYDGPIAGLAAAIERSASPWLFVCGCDMPLVSGRALAWLSNRREPAVDAVVPTEAGQYHPLHTLYRRTAVESVLDELSGAVGPRVVLESLDRVRPESIEDAPDVVDLERSLSSVDTKRDLATLAPG